MPFSFSSTLPHFPYLSFQPPEMVMDHVKLFQNIPIYAISFNYNDEVANEFLKELASVTGGEFRAYNFGCKDLILQDVQVGTWRTEQDGSCIHLSLRDQGQPPIWENGSHIQNY